MIENQVIKCNFLYLLCSDGKVRKRTSQLCKSWFREEEKKGAQMRRHKRDTEREGEKRQLCQMRERQQFVPSPLPVPINFETKAKQLNSHYHFPHICIPLACWSEEEERHKHSSSPSMGEKERRKIFRLLNFMTVIIN